MGVIDAMTDAIAKANVNYPRDIHGRLAGTQRVKMRIGRTAEGALPYGKSRQATWSFDFRIFCRRD